MERGFIDTSTKGWIFRNTCFRYNINMENESTPQDEALVAVLLKLTELSIRTKWLSSDLDQAYKEGLRAAFKVVQDQRREVMGKGKAPAIANRVYARSQLKE